MTDERFSRLSRRGLLLGAGAGAVVAATAVPAGADPGPGSAGPSSTDGGVAPHGSPVASTLASAPTSGLVYRYVSQFDFVPESLAAGRSFGSFGFYTPTSLSNLWASIEIPAGALVRELEWYVHNTSANATNLLGRLWVAGNAFVSNVVLDLSAAPGSGIQAYRGTVPTAGQGPFPAGTKLALGIMTSTNGTVQINGARAGFSQGGAEVGQLATPVRAYDSRVSGGILSAGETRTITLPSAVFRPGMSGAVLNVVATDAAGPGYLKVYPAGGVVPAASALNYAGPTAVANSVTVGASASGKVSIYTQLATHVVVDVEATLG